MKKIAYILSVALVAAACSKTENPVNNNEPQQPATGEVEFSAVFDEVPVKSELSGSKVLWKAGDEISILWEGGKTTAQADADGEEANFPTTVDAASEYFAVYPSAASVTLSEGALTVGIPAEQNGKFEDANIAIAKTVDRSLVFKNLCALGKITLSRDDIAKVEFKGNGTHNLAGNATLSLDNNGIPSVVSVASPAETIVLTPASGDAFAAGSYYFATIPSTLEQGVSFTLTTVSGNTIFGKSSPNPNELVRSEALSFGTLDATGSPTSITVTFDFTRPALTGWPTGTSPAKDLENTSAEYPVDETNYTFTFRYPTTSSEDDAGIYWGNSGTYGNRFIINGRFKYAGLPAIEGYKLVTAKFWQARIGTSDKTNIPAVVIAKEAHETMPSSPSEKNHISRADGGDPKEWEAGVGKNELGGPYTYNLTNTVAGATYYALVYYTSSSWKSTVVGIGKMELTYEKATE